MQQPFAFPRVQVIPEPTRASFRVSGTERLGYDFGVGHPRPFLYPILSPSGAPLTRMGHPNPVGHEHHRSAWFGHQSVAGLNFWEERPSSDLQVAHRRVVAYEDGPTGGGLAADIEWRRGTVVFLKHHLILWLEAPEGGEGSMSLDVQSRFESPDGRPVALGKTNFGFFGVRVAKAMSERFGGGRLTNAEGATGEPAIFAKRSRWVDYSGPTSPGTVEGIAYLDHSSNPHHPTPWHVRADGWMEAAFNLEEGYGVAADHPLDLRYRLVLHPGPADASRIDAAWRAFADTAPLAVVKLPSGLPSLQRVGDG
jgi:hypothetical protein